MPEELLAPPDEPLLLLLDDELPEPLELPELVVPEPDPLDCVEALPLLLLPLLREVPVCPPLDLEPLLRDPPLLRRVRPP